MSLALGILALALLFVGSAVVTLEGFARVAGRWQSLLGSGVVWALFVGTGSMYFVEAELVARLGPFAFWWKATALQEGANRQSRSPVPADCCDDLGSY